MRLELSKKKKKKKKRSRAFLRIWSGLLRSISWLFVYCNPFGSFDITYTLVPVLVVVRDPDDNGGLDALGLRPGPLRLGPWRRPRRPLVGAVSNDDGRLPRRGTGLLIARKPDHNGLPLQN